jgi:hypothetical protein
MYKIKNPNNNSISRVSIRKRLLGLDGLIEKHPQLFSVPFRDPIIMAAIKTKRSEDRARTDSRT